MTDIPPRIGITVGSPRDEARKNYVAAVERAGGQAFVIKPEDDVAIVDTLDGLLLSGGGDVNPAIYGADRHPRTSYVNDDRDTLEIAATRRAFDRDLPVLGICRGFQVLNVVEGGTLIQHLDGHSAKGWESAYHTIAVEPGSLIAAAVGEGDLPVNSRHHQGLTMNEIAPALRNTALSPDGYVEAFENPARRWTVGIQCHPERADEVDPRFRGLFETFVNEARRARDARD